MTVFKKLWFYLKFFEFAKADPLTMNVNFSVFPCIFSIKILCDIFVSFTGPFVMCVSSSTGAQGRELPAPSGHYTRAEHKAVF